MQTIEPTTTRAARQSELEKSNRTAGKCRCGQPPCPGRKSCGQCLNRMVNCKRRKLGLPERTGAPKARKYSTPALPTFGDPYTRGIEAFSNRHALEGNPHPLTGSEAKDDVRHLWAMGWNDARTGEVEPEDADQDALSEYVRRGN